MPICPLSDRPVFMGIYCRSSRNYCAPSRIQWSPVPYALNTDIHTHLIPSYLLPSSLYELVICLSPTVGTPLSSRIYCRPSRIYWSPVPFLLFSSVYVIAIRPDQDRRNKYGPQTKTTKKADRSRPTCCFLQCVAHQA